MWPKSLEPARSQFPFRSLFSYFPNNLCFNALYTLHFKTFVSVRFFTFFQHGCIKLIEIDSKYIYNVTRVTTFKL